MSLSIRRPLALSLVTAGLASASSAQWNEKWASFAPAPSAISAAQAISDDNHETDLDWGDLDGDGDTDLVVVRKQPFTTTGTRTNVLLMNESGVLTDRTATLAVASDVPGDQGFLTPTNDRDVVLADVNGDGLLDVITVTEQTVGLPKHVSHPRVYMNLGSAGGSWQGLRYEEARIPQLLHDHTGIPLEPRFAAVDAADLNMDGSVDLYFGDHDTGLVLFGPTQPPGEDSNDRALVNDGNGFFSDSGLSMLNSAMLNSGFCNSVELVDVNQDGAIDVVKQSSYNNPSAALIAYNDPGNPGVFTGQEIISQTSPYFINSGDLNRDGRIDVAITSNSNDFVLFNTGNDGSGEVVWSAPTEYDFLVGGEPVGSTFAFSYSSNNLIVDVDGDGWSEVLVADVDVEIPDYSPGLRLHLYHNRGGTQGGTDIVLREERASSSDDYWVGADGLTPDDLRWTHDVAVFDVNGDTKLDLVLSRREGTQVWLQVDPPVCQTDLGFGQGAPVLEVCGGDLSTGNPATFHLFAGEPAALTFVVAGMSANPTVLPGLGITLVPAPPLQLVVLTSDANGELSLPLPGGVGPLTLVFQCVQLDPVSSALLPSNAVEVDFLP